MPAHAERAGERTANQKNLANAVGFFRPMGFYGQMEANDDDIRLARWLAGEMSESELAELQASGDLEILQRIVDQTGRWNLPPVKSTFEDLKNRTGLNINRFEIGKINFLNDTAQIFIYYFEDEQKGHYKDEGISSS